MQYVKIPIKTKQEGVEIAEEHFGTMHWRKMDNGGMEAYPHDDANPVQITVKQSFEFGCRCLRGYFKYSGHRYCPDCGSIIDKKVG
jgi:hypothetical protein